MMRSLKNNFVNRFQKSRKVIWFNWKVLIDTQEKNQVCYTTKKLNLKRLTSLKQMLTMRQQVKFPELIGISSTNMLWSCRWHLERYCNQLWINAYISPNWRLTEVSLWYKYYFSKGYFWLRTFSTKGILWEG